MAELPSKINHIYNIAKHTYYSTNYHSKQENYDGTINYGTTLGVVCACWIGAKNAEDFVKNWPGNLKVNHRAFGRFNDGFWQLTRYHIIPIFDHTLLDTEEKLINWLKKHWNCEVIVEEEHERMSDCYSWLFRLDKVRFDFSADSDFEHAKRF